MRDYRSLHSMIANIEDHIAEVEGAVTAIYVIADDMRQDETKTALYYLSTAALDHLKELERCWSAAYKASGIAQGPDHSSAPSA